MRDGARDSGQSIGRLIEPMFPGRSLTCMQLMAPVALNDGEARTCGATYGRKPPSSDRGQWAGLIGHWASESLGARTQKPSQRPDGPTGGGYTTRDKPRVSPVNRSGAVARAACHKSRPVCMAWRIAIAGLLSAKGCLRGPRGRSRVKPFVPVPKGAAPQLSSGRAPAYTT